MSTINIGRAVKQLEGYKAFVPEKFPPDGIPRLLHAQDVARLLSEANILIGRLDGIAKLLPDIDFFILMYVKKEASLSSQIEGTKARLADALQAEVEKTPELPPDVDDILHYIHAMNAGLKKLGALPLSLRLIKEVHKVLMTGARSSQYAMPGEFRRDQNWVNGTSPVDARFVPPPPHLILPAMSDLEKFFHARNGIPVLVKAGLLHAQFETIHPFRDGNGRAGRLLVAFYLCQQNILERPVLYLSEFFKRHRETYFSRLDEYRKGNAAEWLAFFLKGVAAVAKEAISVSDKIVVLRERDMQKISSFGKKTSAGALVLLKELYRSPIVNARRVSQVTGFSRQGAYNLIDKFVKAGILTLRRKQKYGRSFVHGDYLKLFDGE